MKTLEALIDAATVDQSVDLSTVTSGRYDRVTFDCSEYTTGKEYSYALHSPRRFSATFPMKDAHNVKTWKTLAGAKSHFLKMYNS